MAQVGELEIWGSPAAGLGSLLALEAELKTLAQAAEMEVSLTQSAESGAGLGT